MEHVIVRFVEDRDVIIDGQISGKTNATIMVEEGHHTFSLGGASNYAPASQEVEVTETSAIRPLEVVFTIEEEDR